MSTPITIAEELLHLYPQTNLGVLRYIVDVKPYSAELDAKLATTTECLQEHYKLEDIAKLPQISATRLAYKAFGKAPSEYRNSAEAMLRRIVKNLGLYKINTVVDTGNLFSVLSGFSVGSYEVSKIKGDIMLKHAVADTHYEGIGKSCVNIGNLPVLFDDDGAFGNPCSDSQRTMVTEGKKEILSVIYAFGTREELSIALEEYAMLLQQYCQADIREKRLIL